MKDFASTVSESIKQLGQAFLIAYYLPASAFVLVHLYLLIPVWTGAPASFLATTGEAALPLIGDLNLASLIEALLLPLAVGILLVGLNSVLILAFEGRFGWLKHGPLYPLTRFNRKRCQKLYAHLVGLQEEYRRVADLLARARSSEQQPQVERQLAGLALQLAQEHAKLEEKRPRQDLPHAVHRVCPTSFGNAYAVAEEYAYERYGIDAVLIWPRLRELMHDAVPAHSERITAQKIALDLALNFTLICAVLALEAALTLRFGPAGHRGLLLWLVLLAGVLCVGFYRSSVGAVAALGELVKNSFDFHRQLVLKALELQAPAQLIVEQAVWVQLMAFIRRGEEFYLTEARTLARAGEDRDEG